MRYASFFSTFDLNLPALPSHISITIVILPARRSIPSHSRETIAATISWASVRLYVFFILIGPLDIRASADSCSQFITMFRVFANTFSTMLLPLKKNTTRPNFPY